MVSLFLYGNNRHILAYDLRNQQRCVSPLYFICFQYCNRVCAGQDNLTCLLIYLACSVAILLDSGELLAVKQVNLLTPFWILETVVLLCSLIFILFSLWSLIPMMSFW